MSGVGRGDVLGMVLSVGKSLGVAAVDLTLRPERAMEAIVDTLAFCDELDRVDPVAARVCREATHELLHRGEDVVEATATETQGAAPGQLAAGPDTTRDGA